MSEVPVTVPSVAVRLPGVLRPYADGATTLQVEVPPDGTTLRDVLDRLDEQHVSLGRRLRDERGSIRRHVNIYVDGTGAPRAELLDREVRPGAEILVAPAVSGG